MKKILINGINYELIPSNQTASVCQLDNGIKYKGNIVIPSSVSHNGISYCVTSIGSSAFSGCRGLTSIEISSSVTSIGDSAFRGCRGLTSIEIPNSVTSIGVHAFSGCTGLTSIMVDTENCSFCSVDGVLFNKDLTTIVCFPVGKQEQTYEIPNSVTSIGDSAFEGCAGLTSIEIPNSVTSIGKWAFSGCTGFPIEDGIRYANTYLIEVVDKTQNSYLIKEGTRFIGDSAFSGCTGLTFIEIPNSVTSIGVSAFSGCTGLTSIEIPNSVTSIGNWAFSGCTCLTSIEIPNSVTSIGVFAFSGCTGLTSIEIPNSVTSIGWNAFRGCRGLTSIEIPNSVGRLRECTFDGCRSLRSMSILATVFEIDESFVANVGPQLEITVAEDNPYYCSLDGSLYTKDMSQLIHHCEHDLQTCVLPEGIVRIAYCAFEWTHIAQITLPESLTEIAHDAFWWSENKELYIPSGIQKIGQTAFCNSAMTKLHIRSEHPEQIEVAEDAFEGCAEHCTLYVPVGTGYAYRHHSVFGKFREVVIERASSI